MADVLYFPCRKDGLARESFTAQKPTKLHPLGSVIDSVIDSVGLTQRYNGSQVIERWIEIVGDQIAARAKAVKFDNGTLYVVVEDSSWRQNLSMELEQILAQIRKYPFGQAVKEIRLLANQRGM
jgi:predicted nucleic acid-binding Zn ribbon protein